MGGSDSEGGMDWCEDSGQLEGGGACRLFGRLEIGHYHLYGRGDEMGFMILVTATWTGGRLGIVSSSVSLDNWPVVNQTKNGATQLTCAIPQLSENASTSVQLVDHFVT